MVCALPMSKKAQSQVLRYSSPNTLQMRDRCELNFKDVYWINCEIYCYNRPKEYIHPARPANCFPTFLFVQLMSLESQNRKGED